MPPRQHYYRRNNNHNNNNNQSGSANNTHHQDPTMPMEQQPIVQPTAPSASPTHQTGNTINNQQNTNLLPILECIASRMYTNKGSAALRSDVEDNFKFFQILSSNSRGEDPADIAFNLINECVSSGHCVLGGSRANQTVSLTSTGVDVFVTSTKRFELVGTFMQAKRLSETSAPPQQQVGAHHANNNTSNNLVPAPRSSRRQHQNTTFTAQPNNTSVPVAAITKNKASTNANNNNNTKTKFTTPKDIRSVLNNDDDSSDGDEVCINVDLRQKQADEEAMKKSQAAEKEVARLKRVHEEAARRKKAQEEAAAKHKVLEQQPSEHKKQTVEEASKKQQQVAETSKSTSKPASSSNKSAKKFSSPKDIRAVLNNNDNDDDSSTDGDEGNAGLEKKQAENKKAEAEQKKHQQEAARKKKSEEEAKRKQQQEQQAQKQKLAADEEARKKQLEQKLAEENEVIEKRLQLEQEATQKRKIEEDAAQQTKLVAQKQLADETERETLMDKQTELRIRIMDEKNDAIKHLQKAVVVSIKEADRLTRVREKEEKRQAFIKHAEEQTAARKQAQEEEEEKKAAEKKQKEKELEAERIEKEKVASKKALESRIGSHLKNGEYDNAKKIFNEYLASTNNNNNNNDDDHNDTDKHPSELLATGLDHLKNNRYLFAAMFFTLAIDASCNNNNSTETISSGLANRSRCHFYFSHFDLAFQDATRCCELRPQWAEGWKQRALSSLNVSLHSKSNINKTALESFKKYFDLAEESDREYKKMKGEFESLKRSIEVEKQRSISKLKTLVAQLRYSQALAFLDHMDEEIAVLETFSDGDKKILGETRALCFLKTGEAEKSLTEAKQLISKFPSFPIGYRRAADANEAMGDFVTAYETFDKYWRLETKQNKDMMADNDHRHALRRKSLAQKSIGKKASTLITEAEEIMSDTHDWESAIELYDLVLCVEDCTDKERYKALLELAKLHWHFANDASRCCEVAEIACKLLPDSASAFALHGKASDELGDKNAALKSIKRYLELDATDAENLTLVEKKLQQNLLDEQVLLLSEKVQKVHQDEETQRRLKNEKAAEREKQEEKRAAERRRKQEQTESATVPEFPREPAFSDDHVEQMNPDEIAALLFKLWQRTPLYQQQPKDVSFLALAYESLLAQATVCGFHLTFAGGSPVGKIWRQELDDNRTPGVAVFLATHAAFGCTSMRFRALFETDPSQAMVKPILEETTVADVILARGALVVKRSVMNLSDVRICRDQHHHMTRCILAAARHQRLPPCPDALVPLIPDVATFLDQVQFLGKDLRENKLEMIRSEFVDLALSKYFPRYFELRASGKSALECQNQVLKEQQPRPKLDVEEVAILLFKLWRASPYSIAHHPSVSFAARIFECLLVDAALSGYELVVGPKKQRVHKVRSIIIAENGLTSIRVSLHDKTMYRMDFELELSQLSPRVCDSNLRPYFSKEISEPVIVDPSSPDFVRSDALRLSAFQHYFFTAVTSIFRKKNIPAPPETLPRQDAETCLKQARIAAENPDYFGIKMFTTANSKPIFLHWALCDIFPRFFRDRQQNVAQKCLEEALKTARDLNTPKHHQNRQEVQSEMKFLLKLQMDRALEPTRDPTVHGILEAQKHDAKKQNRNNGRNDDETSDYDYSKYDPDDVAKARLIGMQRLHFTPMEQPLEAASTLTTIEVSAKQPVSQLQAHTMESVESRQDMLWKELINNRKREQARQQQEQNAINDRQQFAARSRDQLQALSSVHNYLQLDDYTTASVERRLDEQVRGAREPSSSKIMDVDEISLLLFKLWALMPRYKFQPPRNVCQLALTFESLAAHAILRGFDLVVGKRNNKVYKVWSHDRTLDTVVCLSTHSRKDTEQYFVASFETDAEQAFARADDPNNAKQTNMASSLIVDRAAPDFSDDDVRFARDQYPFSNNCILASARNEQPPAPPQSIHPFQTVILRRDAEEIAVKLRGKTGEIGLDLNFRDFIKAVFSTFFPKYLELRMNTDKMVTDCMNQVIMENISKAARVG